MSLFFASTHSGRRSAPVRSRFRLAMSTMCLAITVVLQLAASPLSAAEDSRQPNIVLIMADDLGYGALGCYGQEKIQTPHLDRMAAEGMLFTQAYAGAHVCQPSRSVLMTGKHTGHCAVRANDVTQLLLPEDVTVAEILHQNGYATGVFGKWGLGFEGTTGHPLRQGYDAFFGQLLQVHAHFYHPYWVWENEQKFQLPGNADGGRGQYVQDEVDERAINFIRENADRPFFAYLPSIIPHVELVVPEDSEAPYRGKFPKRAILDPRKGYIGSEDGLATFAGMVSRLDAQVGRVLATLDELGIADNTLVIFTSDNGGQNGGKDRGWTKMTDFFQANGELRGYKGTYYEGGLRVPFIARWPGKIAAGSRSDHILGFQDVLPTACDLIGVDSPTDIDGISFAPTLLGNADQPEHVGLYWEYPVRGGISRGARFGRWKVVQSRPNNAIELYDLDADFSETTDLAGKMPGKTAELKLFMDAAHEPVRDYATEARRTGVEDYVK